MNEQSAEESYAKLHRKMSIISLMAPHPDLLYKEAVTAPGGLSKEQNPILVIPDNGRLGTLTDDEIGSLFQYYTKIHTSAEQKKGFIVIVDRRNDSWPAARATLLKIRDHFPDQQIARIYCLEPSSMIQKTIGAGFKQINGYSSGGYPVIRFVQKPEDFCDGLVSNDQLPPSLGGPLLYDHKAWCEHRLAVEKYEMNTCELDAESTDVMDTMRNSEHPNGTEAVDEMVKEQLVMRNTLKSEINEGIKRGNSLQDCVLQYDQAVVNLDQIPDRMRNILIIRECMERLAQIEKQFDTFWSEHYTTLLQCQQLRKFEFKFRELFPTLSDRLQALDKFHDKIEHAIDSVKADDLMDIVCDLEDIVPQAKDVLAMGNRLITSKRHYADDSIRPKCRELENTISQLESKSKFCNEKLQRCRELEERMEKAEKWCNEGMDRLGTRWLRSPDEPPSEVVRDIDQFLNQFATFKLDNPKEFHTLFKSHATQDMKEKLPELLKDLEEVKGRCLHRRGSLAPLEDQATLTVVAPTSLRSSLRAGSR